MATRIQILSLCITRCSVSTTPPLVSEMGSVALGFISSHNNTQWKKSSSLLYLFMWAKKTITEMPLPTDQFSRSIVSNSLQPHGLQHTRLSCPSPTPGACWNSCPSSWWCHPTISSPVVLFSSRLQSFPAPVSFPVSQFFPSVGQSTGVSTSASVLPMTIQGWFPLGWTGWISLQSKGLSRVFNTTVQKHGFFSTHLSLLSNSHIHMWLLEKP